jgi:hypothetical protein
MATPRKPSRRRPASAPRSRRPASSSAVPRRMPPGRKTRADSRNTDARATRSRWYEDVKRKHRCEGQGVGASEADLGRFFAREHQGARARVDPDIGEARETAGSTGEGPASARDPPATSPTGSVARRRPGTGHATRRSGCDRNPAPARRSSTSRFSRSGGSHVRRQARCAPGDAVVPAANLKPVADAYPRACRRPVQPCAARPLVP